MLLPMPEHRPELTLRQQQIINAGVFQVTWLFCVLGGSAVAVPLTALVVAGHVYWVNGLLKNVVEAASARQKQARKRSLHGVNEHFEPVFNEAKATQIVFQQSVKDRRRELQFIAQAVVIGWLCDALLIALGVLQTDSPWPPAWLTCLWALFATTAGLALKMFHGRLGLCVAAGALFAPLSYVGGARLAGVPLLEPLWLAIAAISLIWALAFPLLIHLYTVNRIKTGDLTP